MPENQPDIEEKLAAAEALLSQQADSFSEALRQLGKRISPALIDGQGWTRLLERARQIPATVAAFPFGFELPLSEREPKADFGISVIGGTRSAAFFKRQGCSRGATAAAAGLTGLLDEIQSTDSAVRRIIGHKMMLEYDVASAPDDKNPAPGIFLRPAEQPLTGNSQQADAAAIVLDATVAAAGWNPEREEHRHVMRVYQALENGTRIDSFGAFPSRRRMIRLAITGFQTAGDILAFLQRAGWSGQPETMISPAVTRFCECDAVVDRAVHIDINSDGPGATLGLSFMTKKRRANDPRYWIDNPRQWATFMDVLRESGRVVPEKLDALADWPSLPEPLICQSGMLLLMRGIHHIKITLRKNRADAVKAYIYCLLCPWPNEYKTMQP